MPILRELAGAWSSLKVTSMARPPCTNRDHTMSKASNTDLPVPLLPAVQCREVRGGDHDHLSSRRTIRRKSAWRRGAGASSARGTVPMVVPVSSPKIESCAALLQNTRECTGSSVASAAGLLVSGTRATVSGPALVVDARARRARLELEALCLSGPVAAAAR